MLGVGAAAQSIPAASAACGWISGRTRAPGRAAPGAGRAPSRIDFGLCRSGTHPSGSGLFLPYVQAPPDWPLVDVTVKPIEEAAAEVVALLGVLLRATGFDIRSTQSSGHSILMFNVLYCTVTLRSRT